jgi:hypothetical protein
VPSIIVAGRALTQVGADGKHLWFVLTDPDPETRKVVIVMLVTEKDHTDKTVSLSAGAHPFITRDSNVNYGSADFIPLSKLEKRLASGDAKLNADMSPKLLKKVRQGLLDSSRTVRYIKDYCRDGF